MNRDHAVGWEGQADQQSNAAMPLAIDRFKLAALAGLVLATGLSVAAGADSSRLLDAIRLGDTNRVHELLASASVRQAESQAALAILCEGHFELRTAGTPRSWNSC